MAVCTISKTISIDSLHTFHNLSRFSVNYFASRNIKILPQHKILPKKSDAAAISVEKSNNKDNNVHQLIIKTTGFSKQFHRVDFTKSHFSCIEPQICSYRNVHSERKTIKPRTDYLLHCQGPLFVQSRTFCDDRKPAKPVSMPRLMDFHEQVAWPNIFKAIRNWILANFIITPYFDREFNVQDFIEGSKQVMCNIQTNPHTLITLKIHSKFYNGGVHFGITGV